MAKKKTEPDIIHTTNEGRMYIKSSDFFKQEKVKVLIEKLENSSIFQEIEKHKKEKCETT